MGKAIFATVLLASLLSGCTTFSSLGQSDTTPEPDQQTKPEPEKAMPVPGQQLTVGDQAWMVTDVYTAASGAYCAKLRGGQGRYRVACLGQDGWYLVRDLVLSPAIGGSAW